MFGFFESRVQAFPPGAPDLPPRSFAAFIWRCTEGSRGWVLLLMLLTAAIGVFDAVLFAALGRVVDWLGQTQPAHLWAQRGGLLTALAVVIAASVGVVWLQTTVQHQALAINFPMRLRWNFHRLLLGQSMTFYQDEFSGRITSRLMQTALAVRDLIFTVAEVVVGMLIYIVTIMVFAAAFDIRLVLPFAVWLVAYSLACVYFVPRVAKVGRDQADARSLMTGRISDAYTNIATVKLFSHSQREAGFARQAMREFQGTGFAQMRLVSSFETVNHALSMSLIVGVAGCSLWLWTHGLVGVGAIAAATAMALRLNGMAHWIMWQLSSMFENIGTVQDGIKTLSTPQAVLDAPAATTLRVPHGEVRFENMRFSYPAGPQAAVAGAAPSRPIVDGLDLVVRPGEKIGLVGRSGAGKSTLVNLLLRFYELDGGRILIDGQDIAGVTQDSLRASIGMVTQDTSLLHRSVRDNIAYGRPDADDADIRHAAERTEAAGFIAQLSDAKGRTGYDAHVGERGVKLSGGQRQRIAIARVMLKDAPILLLDEATSALDSEVESAIQQSLYRLMEGKTVIAIAHRLSTIAAMDRLVVLDGGRIAEVGDHRTLMAAGGIYARLWAHQTGGFLGESADD
ncbi:ATP-binding cassette domain-containing protein [Xylophilus sp. Kf1]|nr:ATP-binding cassette domain-containing protein [Xylophilus sp. Kf1]